MKVSDVMRKQVDFVNTETSVSDVVRIIFGMGINGLPVCEEGKVVGFITEKDILARFYPSMQDYIEDPFHSSDFEEMEEKVSDILKLPAKEIMSKNPITVTPDTPLLRAQSLMFVREVGRLSVVDKKGYLVGILSKGDVFRTIIGEKLPLEEEEGFFDWLARYYDNIIDWDKRLSVEIPSLAEVFKKEKVRKVIDIASSTGEHTIALAKKGFYTVGLDASSLMWKTANKKAKNLSETVRKNIKFLEEEYKDIASNLSSDFDAAIFMGNALPHVMLTDENILRDVLKVLSVNKPMAIFQMINYEKALSGSGLREFSIKILNGKKYAFVRFNTKEKDKVLFTFAVFEFGKGNWIFRGVRSTPVAYLSKKAIEDKLKKAGFSNIKIYGSSMYGPMFKKTFDPLEDDWFNVVAKR